MKTRFILVVALLVVGILPTTVNGADRPNIILIMSDDMGYSDLGCYGGEIATPSLDALAKGGVRFTQFYNTARCCPTRASLMTGLHPHQAGVGHMMENHNLPGYQGWLLPSCVTIAEALRPAGYATFGVGKWHLGGPQRTDRDNKANWPTSRGFDKYYGIIAGAANFFEPASLIRNATPISPFADPEYKPNGEYYFTDAISDNAVRYIENHHRDDPKQPFFMYVAYTAAHWPMQAKETDIAKYRGKYDGGYDPIRSERFARMRAMGLLDERWELTPKSDDWNRVENKEWESRCMEVYAAMIDSMDQGIGRIVESLKQTGEYNNTAIFYLQDNGACAENAGRSPRNEFPQRVAEPVFEPYTDDVIVHAPEYTSRTRDGFPIIHGSGVMPGPRDTFIAYGRGWANVSNTPFREYKHWVHEGGIATPLVVHAPSQIDEKMRGKFVHEYGQLVDLMATCVDLAGATYPEKRGDVNVTPMQGTSLKPAMTGEPLMRTVPLFWEHEGNRAVRDGKWKLVAKGANSAWELYDMEADRSEMKDLAAQYPEVAEKMASAWEEWAVRANVVPWPWGDRVKPEQSKNGLKLELLFDKRNGNVVDSSGNDNSAVVNGVLNRSNEGGVISAVFDGKTRIDVAKSPSLRCAGTPFFVEADVFSDAPNGVILANGGSAFGYILFLQDGRPGFAVRNDGELRVVNSLDVVTGWKRIAGVVTPEKHVQVRVDGNVVADASLTDFIQNEPKAAMTIASARDNPVLEKPLPDFTGKMKSITVYRGMPDATSPPTRSGNNATRRQLRNQNN